MHRDLGAGAQFVDMHRKVMKLKRAVWQGVDTTHWREQPREIALDVIGHALLLILELDREAARGRRPSL